MATRSEVHGWLRHLGSAGKVGNKIRLAVCVYLAQPKIPDVASILELEMGTMSMETGREGMKIKVRGVEYSLPRLPDVLCCPVAAFGMEMFTMMNSGGGGLDDLDALMRKKVFSAAGDGSAPVITEEQFCRGLGEAMRAVDGVERGTDAVLQHLSRTREGWDSSEDERGVPCYELPPGRRLYPSQQAAPGSTHTRPAAASTSTPAPNDPAPDSKVCSVCGRGGKTMTCSQCKLVRYCSVDCQRSDWRSHKLVCKKAEK